MNFSLLYLGHRALYRLRRFLADWYGGGFLFTWHLVRGLLADLDRTLAFRITIQNLFQPLYQDFTVLGYILGFIFRVLRVAIGLLLYPIVVGLGALGYLLWASAPILILYAGATGRL